MPLFDDIDGSDRGSVCAMLNRLYASEVVAAQQYYRHANDVKGPGCIGHTKMFLEHAEDEEKHAKMLRKAIAALGGQLTNKLSLLPSLNPASSPDVDSSPVTSEMFQQDRISERDAKVAYHEAILKVRDTFPSLADTLCDILRDEFEHHADLDALLMVE